MRFACRHPRIASLLGALIILIIIAGCGSTTSMKTTTAGAVSSHSATLVSCLTTKGLAIGWYDPSNTDANGNESPTTLPASFDFAKGGIQNYSVVKGHLPVEGPKGPPPNSPILNVSYQPDAAVNVREAAGHPPGLVAIGNFTVAWQHEPQSGANVVIACVRHYTHPVNDAAAQRAQEAAINRALAGFKPPTNASTWTASTRAVFLNGCENAGGDTPSTCQCALTALVTNVNYLDFLSIEQSYRGSGIPQKLLQYIGKCVLPAAQTVTTPTAQTCSGKYYTPSMAAAGCPTEGRGPKPTAANRWPCPAGDTEMTNSAGLGCTGAVAPCANGCNYVPANVPATPTTSTSSTASTTTSDTSTTTGEGGPTCTTTTPGEGGGTPACDGATSNAGGGGGGGIGGPGD